MFVADRRGVERKDPIIIITTTTTTTTYIHLRSFHANAKPGLRAKLNIIFNNNVY